MHAPRLPPELFDAIIDHLHDDRHTLATCALVCRGWLPASRMHNFHELSIHRYSISQQPCELLCDSTSTVLPYVRRLRLDLGGSSRDSASTFAFESPWLNSMLPRMRLRELTALQHFELRCLRWEYLSPESRACILAACNYVRSLTLQTLVSPTVSPALEMLSAAPLIEHFELSRSVHIGDDRTILDSSSPSFVDWRMPGTLRSVTIGIRCPFFLVALDRFTPALRIRTLSVTYVEWQEARNVAAFMKSCGPSLEHVHVTFGPSDSDHSSGADMFREAGGFSFNTSLRTLTLSTYPHAAPMLSVLQQVPSSVMEIVRVVATSQSLKTVDLVGLASVFRAGPLSAARLEIIVIVNDVADSLVEARGILHQCFATLEVEGRFVLGRVDRFGKDLPPLGV
ncbi:uncharacterized protein B0H18DRAFT_1101996 [Fomitopsis serialis]|uniref:uncharacterized protein n=1 Tax=Fomitopsis serialis TaxID=139415 RepID=UPI002007697D|nr:uncharacterized protein B0H18DRAFT_1101996 [Neoantrodia serialis]KAH9933315.1 hypothetical protein B0H18DRAFT_1101996 [Neoantrodia serialis]